MVENSSYSFRNFLRNECGNCNLILGYSRSICFQRCWLARLHVSMDGLQINCFTHSSIHFYLHKLNFKWCYYDSFWLENDCSYWSCLPRSQFHWNNLNGTTNLSNCWLDWCSIDIIPLYYYRPCMWFILLHCC